MKLAVSFGLHAKPYIIEWDLALSDLPNIFLLDDKYWQCTFYDKDQNHGTDCWVIYGEMNKSAIPLNMNGNPFPVSDFRYMFQIETVTGPCECGAKFTSFPNHHMIGCPKWSKK